MLGNNVLTNVMVLKQARDANALCLVCSIIILKVKSLWNKLEKMQLRRIPVLVCITQSHFYKLSFYTRINFPCFVICRL